jgi:predicted transcriptional regulator
MYAYLIPGDQKVSVYLHSVYSNNPHKTDELKMAITEYIRNVDRAILNTVFENTVQRVNKCLETGGGHFEHHL